MLRIRDDGRSVVHRFAPTLVFMGRLSVIATASGCVTCRALRNRSICVWQRAASSGVLRTSPDGSGFVTYFAMYERKAPDVQCWTFMPAPQAKSHSGTYGEMRESMASRSGYSKRSSSSLYPQSSRWFLGYVYLRFAHYSWMQLFKM
jgi:hypothetical protein